MLFLISENHLNRMTSTTKTKRYRYLFLWFLNYLYLMVFYTLLRIIKEHKVIKDHKENKRSKMTQNLHIYVKIIVNFKIVTISLALFESFKRWQ